MHPTTRLLQVALNKNNIRALNLTKPSGRGSCARIAGVWEANKLEKKPLMKAIIEEKAWVAIGVEVLIFKQEMPWSLDDSILNDSFWILLGPHVLLNRLSQISFCHTNYLGF